MRRIGNDLSDKSEQKWHFERVKETSTFIGQFGTAIET